MRRKLMVSLFLAASAALVIGVSTGGAAAQRSAKKVTCHVRLFDQSPPTALEGFDLGFTTCSGPFGSGLQWDHFKVRLTSPTTAVLTGPFKDFFEQGSIHGRFELHGTQASTTGTLWFLGGTGAFKGVRGHGRLECTGISSSNETDCTAVAEITGI